MTNWISYASSAAAAALLVAFGFMLGRATANLRAEPPPVALEDRVIVLERAVACWQTIHPKRCQ